MSGPAPSPVRPLPRRALAVLASPRWRLGLLSALLVAAVTVAATSPLPVTALVDGALGSLGPAAPVAFAVTYAVAMTLLLPAAPFTIGAGLAFGPALGTVTALAGATAGATGAFLLGRVVGRDAIVTLAGPRLSALDRWIARRGYLAVLIARLVPLFPFAVVNLGAGVSDIRLRDYVLATGVGIVPGTVVYAALGGTLTDPTSGAFLAAGGVFVLVTVAAGLAARRLRGVEA